MSDLIRPHYVQYRTAARVNRRQTCQMFVQMTFNLPLGLDNKAEARSIPGRGCKGTDGK